MTDSPPRWTDWLTGACAVALIALGIWVPQVALGAAIVGAAMLGLLVWWRIRQ